MRILFITTGDRFNPSTRLRVYQYLNLFQEEGFETQVVQWPKSRSSRMRILPFIVWRMYESDVIFVQRVVFGRLFLDTFLSTLELFAKPLFFDFDDAIYAIPSSQIEVSDGLVCSPRKPLLDKILPQAKVVLAGNSHLADYAQRRNPNVEVLPTVLDVPLLPTKDHINRKGVVIGWIGTPDNFFYLQTIRPALERLCEKYGSRIILRVISSKRFVLDSAPVENVTWGLDKEIEQVLSLDVGIMPLTTDEWARGKSGFKAIFYQSLGIPAVVTPTEVVQNGRTGFYASTIEEWIDKISLLVDDISLRKAFGLSARNFMERKYSLEHNFRRLLTLLSTTVYR